MKKILAVLSLIFTISGALAYQQENIAISDYEFRRYVRPQLKSISNEYQTLFFALNPELKDFKSTYSYFRDLSEVALEMKDSCKESGPGCLRLAQSANKLLGQILKDFSKSPTPELAPFSKRGAVYSDAKEKVQKELMGALLSLDNHLFLRSLTGEFPNSIKDFPHEFNALTDEFSSFLFKTSDERFRNELNSFWVNFIKPIEKYALYANDRNYFRRNLTDLNLVIHMLGVRLTKRSYEPTKQVSTLINIMLRRWNNILKVSLKPKG